MPAVELVDPALLRTAAPNERLDGKNFIGLTLCEAYGNTQVPLKEGDQANGEFHFLGRQSHHYTLVFEQGLARELVFELQNSDGQVVFTQTSQLEGEVANAADAGWQSFVLRMPALPGNGEYSLRIISAGEPAALRRLRLLEVSPDLHPWHELRQGEALERTLFLFAEEMQSSPRNLHLQSQLHLADGLGFHGRAVEKVVYADAKLVN